VTTIEIPDRDLQIQVPSDWSEMTPDQRSFCLNRAIMLSDGQIEFGSFLVECFYKLTDLQRSVTSIIKERIAGHDALAEKNRNLRIYAEAIVAPIFGIEDPEQQFEIKYECVTPPVLDFSLRKGLQRKQFIAPGSLLQNCSFGEVRAAILAQNLFFESKDEKHLDRLVACLYRPKRKDLKSLQESEDFDGHQKEQFNRDRILYLATWTTKITSWKKMAVLMWFSFCISAIQSEDLTINGREINLSHLFPKADPDHPPKPDKSAAGWDGILNAIAKKQVFGSAQQVDQIDFFEILLFMYDEDAEIQRLKPKN